MNTTKSQTKKLALIGVMSAVMCVLSPLSLPIGPVPISLGSFTMYLATIILGAEYASISCALYILIGALGVPVFAGYTAGFSVVVGPTGGYLIGFLGITLLGGALVKNKTNNKVHIILSLILGTLICYAMGTIWLGWQLGLSFFKALSIGVLPFVIGDLIKIVIATQVGVVVAKRLKSVLS